LALFVMSILGGTNCRRRSTPLQMKHTATIA
jgi:hypothetical protein